MTTYYLLRCLLFFAAVSFSYTGSTQSYNHYYGNIHSHTGYSDGAKDGHTSGIITPAQAYEFAKGALDFDFLGISDHNHSRAGMLLSNYHKGLAEADAANEEGRFVCLYGMEYGTVKDGHILIYGIDRLINWEEDNCDLKTEKGDYRKIWDMIKDDPDAFATLAHPVGRQYNDLINRPYDIGADLAICGVAVKNGPHASVSVSYDDPPKQDYYRYYKRLLAEGYKVGPVIDHDNHNTTLGMCSQGRTVVLAESLTRNNIIDAYRRMRFYASDDYNVKVEFIVNGKPMGSSVQTNVADIRVNITDPDSSDRMRSVKLMRGMRGSGVMAETMVHETFPCFEYSISILPEDNLYLFLEITQEDGDNIYTAPVWIKGQQE